MASIYSASAYGDYAFNYVYTGSDYRDAWTAYQNSYTAITQARLQGYGTSQDLFNVLLRFLYSDNDVSAAGYEDARGRILSGLLGWLTPTQRVYMCRVAVINVTGVPAQESGGLMAALISRCSIKTLNPSIITSLPNNFTDGAVLSYMSPEAMYRIGQQAAIKAGANNLTTYALTVNQLSNTHMSLGGEQFIKYCQGWLEAESSSDFIVAAGANLITARSRMALQAKNLLGGQLAINQKAILFQNLSLGSSMWYRLVGYFFKYDTLANRNAYLASFYNAFSISQFQAWLTGSILFSEPNIAGALALLHITRVQALTEDQISYMRAEHIGTGGLNLNNLTAVQFGYLLSQHLAVMPSTFFSNLALDKFNALRHDAIVSISVPVLRTFGANLISALADRNVANSNFMLSKEQFQAMTNAQVGVYLRRWITTSGSTVNYNRIPSEVIRRIAATANSSWTWWVDFYNGGIPGYPKEIITRCMDFGALNKNDMTVDSVWNPLTNTYSNMVVRDQIRAMVTRIGGKYFSEFVSGETGVKAWFDDTSDVQFQGLVKDVEYDFFFMWKNNALAISSRLLNKLTQSEFVNLCNAMAVDLQTNTMLFNTLLSSSSLNGLNSSYLLVMPPAAVGLLSATTLNGLSEGIVRNLTASFVSNLSAQALLGLSARFLNFLSTDANSPMGNVVGAFTSLPLPAATWSQLEPRFFNALSTNFLSNTALNGGNFYGALNCISDANIPQLSVSFLNALPQNAIDMMINTPVSWRATNFADVIPINKRLLLDLTKYSVLITRTTAAQLNTLSLDEVRAIPVSALSLLGGSVLAGLSQDRVQVLSSSQLLGVTLTQVQNMTDASFFNQFTAAQMTNYIHSVPNQRFSFFSMMPPAVVAGLDVNFFNNVNSAVNQMIGLNHHFLNNVNETVLSNVAQSVRNGISSNLVGVLTEGRRNIVFREAYYNALSDASIVGLTSAHAAQLVSLSPTNLNANFIDKLSNAELLTQLMNAPSWANVFGFVESVRVSGRDVYVGERAFSAGMVITFTVTMTQAVSFSGNDISLSLSNGGVATYVSGNTSRNLVFSYTVPSSQNVSSLTVTGFNWNGSTLTSRAANFSGVTMALPEGLRIDTVAPTITLSTSNTNVVGSINSPIITFSLSESTTNFTLGDVNVSGGSLTSFTGSGASYTAVFMAGANSTLSASISVVGTRFTDGAGNNNTASNTLTLEVDTIAPRMVVSRGNANVVSSTNSPIITFSLSENTSDFSLDDVSVIGGSLTNFTGSGASYTAIFVANTNSTGLASILVEAARFTDEVGHNNTASNRLDLVVDTVIPDAPIILDRILVRNEDSNIVQFKLDTSSSLSSAGDVIDLLLDGAVQYSHVLTASEVIQKGVILDVPFSRGVDYSRVITRITDNNGNYSQSNMAYVFNNWLTNKVNEVNSEELVVTVRDTVLLQIRDVLKNNDVLVSSITSETWNSLVGSLDKVSLSVVNAFWDAILFQLNSLSDDIVADSVIIGDQIAQSVLKQRIVFDATSQLRRLNSGVINHIFSHFTGNLSDAVYGRVVGLLNGLTPLQISEIDVNILKECLLPKFVRQLDVNFLSELFKNNNTISDLPLSIEQMYELDGVQTDTILEKLHANGVSVEDMNIFISKIHPSRTIVSHVARNLGLFGGKNEDDYVEGYLDAYFDAQEDSESSLWPWEQVEAALGGDPKKSAKDKMRRNTRDLYLHFRDRSAADIGHLSLHVLQRVINAFAYGQMLYSDYSPNQFKEIITTRIRDFSFTLTDELLGWAAQSTKNSGVMRLSDSQISSLKTMPKLALFFAPWVTTHTNINLDVLLKMNKDQFDLVDQLDNGIVTRSSLYWANNLDLSDLGNLNKIGYLSYLTNSLLPTENTLKQLNENQLMAYLYVWVNPNAILDYPRTSYMIPPFVFNNLEYTSPNQMRWVESFLLNYFDYAQTKDLKREALLAIDVTTFALLRQTSPSFFVGVVRKQYEAKDIVISPEQFLALVPNLDMLDIFVNEAWLTLYNNDYTRRFVNGLSNLFGSAQSIIPISIINAISSEMMRDMDDSLISTIFDSLVGRDVAHLSDTLVQALAKRYRQHDSLGFDINKFHQLTDHQVDVFLNQTKLDGVLGDANKLKQVLDLLSQQQVGYIDEAFIRSDIPSSVYSILDPIKFAPILAILAPERIINRLADIHDVTVLNRLSEETFASLATSEILTVDISLNLDNSAIEADVLRRILNNDLQSAELVSRFFGGVTVFNSGQSNIIQNILNEQKHLFDRGLGSYVVIPDVALVKFPDNLLTSSLLNHTLLNCVRNMPSSTLLATFSSRFLRILANNITNTDLLLSENFYKQLGALEVSILLNEYVVSHPGVAFSAKLINSFSVNALSNIDSQANNIRSGFVSEALANGLSVEAVIGLTTQKSNQASQSYRLDEDIKNFYKGAQKEALMTYIDGTKRLVVSDDLLRNLSQADATEISSEFINQLSAAQLGILPLEFIEALPSSTVRNLLATVLNQASVLFSHLKASQLNDLPASTIMNVSANLFNQLDVQEVRKLDSMLVSSIGENEFGNLTVSFLNNLSPMAIKAIKVEVLNRIPVGIVSTLNVAFLGSLSENTILGLSSEFLSNVNTNANLLAGLPVALLNRLPAVNFSVEVLAALTESKIKSLSVNKVIEILGSHVSEFGSLTSVFWNSVNTEVIYRLTKDDLNRINTNILTLLNQEFFDSVNPAVLNNSELNLTFRAAYYNNLDEEKIRSYTESEVRNILEYSGMSRLLNARFYNNLNKTIVSNVRVLLNVNGGIFQMLDAEILNILASESFVDVTAEMINAIPVETVKLIEDDFVSNISSTLYSSLSASFYNNLDDAVLRNRSKAFFWGIKDAVTLNVNLIAGLGYKFFMYISDADLKTITHSAVWNAMSSNVVSHLSKEVLSNFSSTLQQGLNAQFINSINPAFISELSGLGEGTQFVYLFSRNTVLQLNSFWIAEYAKKAVSFRGFLNDLVTANSGLNSDVISQLNVETILRCTTVDLHQLTAGVLNRIALNTWKDMIDRNDDATATFFANINLNRLTDANLEDIVHYSAIKGIHILTNSNLFAAWSPTQIKIILESAMVQVGDTMVSRPVLSRANIDALSAIQVSLVSSYYVQQQILAVQGASSQKMSDLYPMLWGQINDIQSKVNPILIVEGGPTVDDFASAFSIIASDNFDEKSLLLLTIDDLEVIARAIRLHDIPGENVVLEKLRNILQYLDSSSLNSYLDGGYVDLLSLGYRVAAHAVTDVRVYVYFTRDQIQALDASALSIFLRRGPMLTGGAIQDKDLYIPRDVLNLVSDQQILHNATMFFSSAVAEVLEGGWAMEPEWAVDFFKMRNSNGGASGKNFYNTLPAGTWNNLGKELLMYISLENLPLDRREILPNLSSNFFENLPSITVSKLSNSVLNDILTSHVDGVHQLFGHGVTYFTKSQVEYVLDSYHVKGNAVSDQVVFEFINSLDYTQVQFIDPIKYNYLITSENVNTLSDSLYLALRERIFFKELPFSEALISSMNVATVEKLFSHIGVSVFKVQDHYPSYLLDVFVRTGIVNKLSQSVFKIELDNVIFDANFKSFLSALPVDQISLLSPTLVKRVLVEPVSATSPVFTDAQLAQLGFSQLAWMRDINAVNDIKIDIWKFSGRQLAQLKTSVLLSLYDEELVRGLDLISYLTGDPVKLHKVYESVGIQLRVQRLNLTQLSGIDFKFTADYMLDFIKAWCDTERGQYSIVPDEILAKLPVNSFESNGVLSSIRAQFFAHCVDETNLLRLNPSMYRYIAPSALSKASSRFIKLFGHALTLSLNGAVITEQQLAALNDSQRFTLFLEFFNQADSSYARMPVYLVSLLTPAMLIKLPIDVLQGSLVLKSALNALSNAQIDALRGVAPSALAASQLNTLAEDCPDKVLRYFFGENGNIFPTIISGENTLPNLYILNELGGLSIDTISKLAQYANAANKTYLVAEVESILYSGQNLGIAPNRAKEKLDRVFTLLENTLSHHPWQLATLIPRNFADIMDLAGIVNSNPSVNGGVDYKVLFERKIAAAVPYLTSHVLSSFPDELVGFVGRLSGDKGSSVLNDLTLASLSNAQVDLFVRAYISTSESGEFDYAVLNKLSKAQLINLDINYFPSMSVSDVANLTDQAIEAVVLLTYTHPDRINTLIPSNFYSLLSTGQIERLLGDFLRISPAEYSNDAFYKYLPTFITKNYGGGIPISLIEKFTPAQQLSIKESYYKAVYMDTPGREGIHLITPEVFSHFSEKIFAEFITQFDSEFIQERFPNADMLAKMSDGQILNLLGGIVNNVQREVPEEALPVMVVNYKKTHAQALISVILNLPENKKYLLQGASFAPLAKLDMGVSQNLEALSCLPKEAFTSAALFSDVINAPLVMNAIVAEDVKRVSSGLAPLLSFEQFNQIPNSYADTYFSAMQSQGKINFEVLKILKPNHVGNIENIHALITPENMSLLPPELIKGFSAVQLQGLSKEVRFSFTDEQMQNISPSLIHSIGDAFEGMFQSPQVAMLLEDQIKELTYLPSMDLQYLYPFLSDTAFNKITDANFLLLDSQVVGALSTNRLAHFSAATLAKLNNLQVWILNPDQVATIFAKSDFTNFEDGSILLGMSQKNFQKVFDTYTLVDGKTTKPLPFSMLDKQVGFPDNVKQISVIELQSLPGGDQGGALGVTDNPFAELSYNVMRELTDTQILNLLPYQMVSMKEEVLQEWLSHLTDTSVMPVFAIDPAKVLELSSTQLSTLTAATVGSLDQSRLEALLMNANRASIPEYAFAELDPELVNLMSVDWLNTLSDAQLSYFSPEFISYLDTAHKNVLWKRMPQEAHTRFLSQLNSNDLPGGSSMPTSTNYFLNTTLLANLPSTWGVDSIAALRNPIDKGLTSTSSSTGQVWRTVYNVATTLRSLYGALNIKGGVFERVSSADHKKKIDNNMSYHRPFLQTWRSIGSVLSLLGNLYPRGERATNALDEVDDLHGNADARKRLEAATAALQIVSWTGSAFQSLWGQGFQLYRNKAALDATIQGLYPNASKELKSILYERSSQTYLTTFGFAPLAFKWNDRKKIMRQFSGARVSKAVQLDFSMAKTVGQVIRNLKETSRVVPPNLLHAIPGNVYPWSRWSWFDPIRNLFNLPPVGQAWYKYDPFLTAEQIAADQDRVEEMFGAMMGGEAKPGPDDVVYLLPEAVRPPEPVGSPAGRIRADIAVSPAPVRVAFADTERMPVDINTISFEQTSTGAYVLKNPNEALQRFIANLALYDENGAIWHTVTDSSGDSWVLVPIFQGGSFNVGAAADTVAEGRWVKRSVIENIYDNVVHHVAPGMNDFSYTGIQTKLENLGDFRTAYESIELTPDLKKAITTTMIGVGDVDEVGGWVNSFRNFMELGEEEFVEGGMVQGSVFSPPGVFSFPEDLGRIPKRTLRGKFQTSVLGDANEETFKANAARLEQEISGNYQKVWAAGDEIAENMKAGGWAFYWANTFGMVMTGMEILNIGYNPNYDGKQRAGLIATQAFNLVGGYYLWYGDHLGITAAKGTWKDVYSLYWISKGLNWLFVTGIVYTALTEYYTQKNKSASADSNTLEFLEGVWQMSGGRLLTTVALATIEIIVTSFFPMGMLATYLLTTVTVLGSFIYELGIGNYKYEYYSDLADSFHDDGRLVEEEWMKKLMQVERIVENLQHPFAYLTDQEARTDLDTFMRSNGTFDNLKHVLGQRLKAAFLYGTNHQASPNLVNLVANLTDSQSDKSKFSDIYYVNFERNQKMTDFFIKESDLDGESRLFNSATAFRMTKLASSVNAGNPVDCSYLVGLYDNGSTITGLQQQLSLQNHQSDGTVLMVVDGVEYKVTDPNKMNAAGTIDLDQYKRQAYIEVDISSLTSNTLQILARSLSGYQIVGNNVTTKLVYIISEAKELKEDVFLNRTESFFKSGVSFVVGSYIHFKLDSSVSRYFINMDLFPSILGVVSEGVDNKVKSTRADTVYTNLTGINEINFDEGGTLLNLGSGYRNRVTLKKKSNKVRIALGMNKRASWSTTDTGFVTSNEFVSGPLSASNIGTLNELDLTMAADDITLTINNGVSGTDQLSGFVALTNSAFGRDEFSFRNFQQIILGGVRSLGGSVGGTSALNIINTVNIIGQNNPIRLLTAAAELSTTFNNNVLTVTNSSNVTLFAQGRTSATFANAVAATSENTLISTMNSKSLNALVGINSFVNASLYGDADIISYAQGSRFDLVYAGKGTHTININDFSSAATALPQIVVSMREYLMTAENVSDTRRNKTVIQDSLVGPRSSSNDIVIALDTPNILNFMIKVTRTEVRILNDARNLDLTYRFVPASSNSTDTLVMNNPFHTQNIYFSYADVGASGPVTINTTSLSSLISAMGSFTATKSTVGSTTVFDAFDLQSIWRP